MLQGNRLTIIVDDGAVYMDMCIVIDLDLSSCGIPDDIHALNWLTDKGEIEFRGTEKDNIPIDSLPDWAHNAADIAYQRFQLSPPEENIIV